jgi:hypothetical protein
LADSYKDETARFAPSYRKAVADESRKAKAMNENDIQNILDAIGAALDAITDQAALRAAINAGYESLVGYRIFDDAPEMETIEGQELFLGVMGEHLRNAA